MPWGHTLVRRWRERRPLTTVAHRPHPLQDGSARSPVYCLDNGASESLKVAPALRRLSFVQFSSAASGSERMGAAINLHFEGNWMPIKVRGERVAGIGVVCLLVKHAQRQPRRLHATHRPRRTWR